MIPAREGQLATVITARREEILRRFVTYARKRGAAQALPPDVIIDSLGAYLDGLVQALNAYALDGAPELSSHAALAHGLQRFDLGYEVAGLVREYAALRDLLWDVLDEASVEVQAWEVRVVFTYVFHGVEQAVDSFARARDAMLREQTARHIGFLAHELRNPLASARMAVGLLRDRGELKEGRAREALERGLMRLTQLIDDSLVGARLKSLGLLDCEAFGVDELLKEVAGESGIDAESKGVVLRVTGVGGARVIEADRKMLRSAISNLIRNAVKFTHPGGEVHVRGRIADARLTIEVEDSCGGLPKGTIAKLFDPFVQAGNDRTGFGLGLAIAKQVAEAHRGQLRVHDLPAKGCVFLIDLPVTNECGEAG